ncbi:phosphoribosylformylglycinamidine synthase, partial [Candidatus Roizmanbacteria bacterium]|nr:phosphoribosylformylglycinamidine synthase [Candidatus Roizmanbacteria bacterium]
VALSQALYPRYSDVDTYHMAASSIDSSIRNLVCVGADPHKIALLDNFCWCSSTEPERLWQLKMAAKACYDYSVHFGAPFISGKDSMFNDFKGFDSEGNPVKVSIPPTLLISSISVMEDVAQAVSLDFKNPGDLIYLIGDTDDELGGSEYFAYRGEQERGKPYIGDSVPKVDAHHNLVTYEKVHKAIQTGLLSASISVGKGGLAVALARMSIGGGLGFSISLAELGGTYTRSDYALFSETQGRILVSIDPGDQSRFETIMNGVPYSLLGKVLKSKGVTIKDIEEELVKTTVDKLAKAYRAPFLHY